MTDSIKRLKELVDSSDNIVFFGGAGVSTESGIPDFRSTGGLYHQEWKYPPEVILSHTFYESNPEEFFRFYRAKLLAPDAKPNAAHKKLAEWEAEGRLKAVITQNIDGLHQAAGSRAGAPRQRPPEPLPAVREILRSGAYPPHGGRAPVQLRRHHQAGCGAL